MTDTHDRFRRILGTGCSFLLFGVAGLLLGAVVSPLLGLRYRDPATRELRVQALNHRGFGAFTRFMEWVGVIRVFASGIAALAEGGPHLLVANHPALIDVVMLGACLPQMDCVVKRAMWSNPLVRGVMQGAGYIPNDDGESTVRACVRRLQAGRTLLLFPEGTRSPRGGLGPLQRGAAHVALASGDPLVPVTITCVPPGLMRDQKWYDVPPRRMQLHLEVGEPIPADAQGASRGSAARRLTGELQERFEKGIEHVGV